MKLMRKTSRTLASDRCGTPRFTRGFTLIEVMVAASLGAVIAAGATSAMVSVYRVSIRLERQAQVDEDAKLVLGALLGRLQEVGGGLFRPHAVVHIVDGADAECASTVTVEGLTMPACDNSDRLSFLVIEDGAPQCQITSVLGVNANFDPLASASCCSSTDLEDHNVVMIDEDTGLWQSRNCGLNTSDCRCEFIAGQAGYEPPLGSLTPTYNYLTQGYAVTLFLDRTDHVLKLMADRDGDTTQDLQIERLAPNIWDFQVSYLFDTDGDGEVDTEQTNYAGITDRSTLRMVRIGLVVGSKIPSIEKSTSGQVLNGPVRTESSGYILRSVVGSTSLRNLNVFY